MLAYAWRIVFGESRMVVVDIEHVDHEYGATDQHVRTLIVHRFDGQTDRGRFLSIEILLEKYSTVHGVQTQMLPVLVLRPIGWDAVDEVFVDRIDVVVRRVDAENLLIQRHLFADIGEVDRLREHWRRDQEG